MHIQNEHSGAMIYLIIVIGYKLSETNFIIQKQNSVS